MLYYFYVSNAGIAETGLVAGSDLAWEYLVTAENGTNKSGTALSGLVTECGGGWYAVDITLGTAPWDVKTEDLVGVIDCDTAGDAGLDDLDRYKPVAFTLRGLALAKISHKATQTKATGDIVVEASDGSTDAFKIDMTNAATTITRNIDSP